MVPLVESIKERQNEGGRLWYASFRASKRDNMKVDVYGTPRLEHQRETG